MTRTTITLSVSALALMVTMSAVWAQQTTNTVGKPAGNVPPVAAGTATTPALPTALPDTVEIPVWPQTAVNLPPANLPPGPVDFRLPDKIEGIDPKLLPGVTAKGLARKVDVDQHSIGQVLVQSVSKGDKTEVIDQRGFVAQFDAKETSELFPESSLEVKGSRAALIAALERLNKGETDKEKKEEKAETKDETGQNSGSGGSSKNAQASSYRSPTETYTSQQDSYTSTEGCSVRIDLASGLVIQQEKKVDVVNGKTTFGGCQDSATNWKIERDYLACDDLVDMDTMTAYQQYQNYYLGAAGSNQTIGTCQPDKDKAYSIKEKMGTCAVSPSISKQVAEPRAVLVYANDKGQEVEVRGCADTFDENDAIPMRQDVAACSIRHNFKVDDSGTSEELGQWVYDLDGTTYAASACVPTGRVFPHKKVYQDKTNQYLCQPLVNSSDQTVTLQYRKAIEIDGAEQFISDCTPDTDPSLRLPVKATGDGCDNPSQWDHDVAAAKSYAKERFFFTKPNGQREYITGCQTSAVSYPHSHTRTGWENHDNPSASNGGYGLPITKVSIDVNGTPYTVLSGEVLPGAVPVNYVKQADLTAGTGNYTYSDCNKYETTLLTKQFKRPDNTILQVPGGAGANRPMGNACTASGGLSTADWTFIRARSATGLEADYGNFRAGCEYKTSRTLVRDDGKTFPGTEVKLTLVQGSNVGSRGATGEILSNVNIAPYVSETYPGYSLIRPSYSDYTSPGSYGWGGIASCSGNATTSAVSLFRAHLGW